MFQLLTLCVAAPLLVYGCELLRRRLTGVR
jgi:hypothetical protein